MSLQHPVVCEQIGHRRLFIGSSRAAAEGGAEQTFSEVITLSSYSLDQTTEFVPLTDGPRVEYSQFRKAVKAVREALQSGRKVLVQCEVGISRSAAVIATVVAVEEGRSFKQALNEVKRYRERASPRQPLRECAKRYLHEEAPTTQPRFA